MSKTVVLEIQHKGSKKGTKIRFVPLTLVPFDPLC